jgi:hypothetical protein
MLTRKGMGTNGQERFELTKFAAEHRSHVLCEMIEESFLANCSLSYNFTMAVPEALRKPTKRKQVDEEDVGPEDLQATGSLEMLSDEEDAGDTSSDDGQVDEFPEIVDESDSDESEEEDDDDDGESQEDDEHDDEGAESDDSLHIFPKAKVVVSEITHQPKTVYPEIEPDYDSDSSTEEVRVLDFIVFCSRSKLEEGPQSCWKYSYALV